MGKKILLADDSITIQKVIELTFSDEDFDVVTVGNGRLAVEKVQEVRPDVVLCDIIMPEKDGYEVCDFIKRNASLSHIPVVLLTGAFEPFDQERAARVGCDGFLAKPFEPETLIAKVKDLLKKAASRTVSSAGLRTPPLAAEPFPAPSREPGPAPPVPTSISPGPPARPPQPLPFPTAAVRPPACEPPPAPPPPPHPRRSGPARGRTPPRRRDRAGRPGWKKRPPRTGWGPRVLARPLPPPLRSSRPRPPPPVRAPRRFRRPPRPRNRA